MPELVRAPSPSEQIVQHYRSAIERGDLKPGEELPANRRLAELWGVATATAFRVARTLRDEGWIETRPGKPPVVADLQGLRDKHET